ncbi:nuclear pore complex protein Nup93-like [Adelges cooleyi]|uniref:nuclear pore complex protein Nup93-like n=1 Tax=Adelges cooleyi TaxID=133065 RepID=UPI00217F9E38|nr:nuclear pore complex protein Nup93-like [Adelges cooleyi]XP_050434634.1 nuclear pore complex protein Nup93-like [Adelges cooleyi]
MAATDLENLLLQGQSLCKDTVNSKPVSKIHKSLRQLCQNADLTLKRPLVGSDEQYAKEFLANRGLDLASYSGVLKKLCTYKDNVTSSGDLKPIMDYSSSVESLMGRHIEDYIKKLEIKDSDETINSLHNISSSWRKMKKDIVYNEFALDSYDVPFCLQNLLTKRNEFLTINPNHVESPKIFSFIADVKSYIKSKEDNMSNKELIEYFLDTISRDNDDAAVAHIWNVVKYIMSNITPFETTSGSFHERFSEDNQANLVKNAKNYLEDKYQAFLIKETRHLNINNDENFMASVISSYVFMTVGRSLGSQQNEFHIDEQTIWPLIYFSLRCGKMDVADYFIQKSGLSLSDFLNVFINLTEANSSDHVGSNVGITLNKFYKTLPAYDNAFRKTLFSLLGMVEANMEKKAVAKTIEDKLWMLLTEHLASKYTEDSNGLDYCSLQRYVLDHGKPYMDQPHVYFELLFLIGHFESAIDFLYRNVKFSNHAVHIAIALEEKKLLATPESLQAPFLSNENVDIKFVRLNYARLILLFCSELETNNPHFASFYYYFLRNLKTLKKDNLFYKCVADLATSYDGNVCDWMFGRLGQEKDNSIFHDVFEVDTIKSIVDKTLELSLEKNKPEVAFKLYMLTSDKAAYGVLNNILSHAIYNYDITSPVKTGEKQNIFNKNFEDRVHLYAEELNEKKISTLDTIGPVATFRLLRQMFSFFYHTKKIPFLCVMEKAIETDLVPFSSDDTKQCLLNCTRQSELVQRNISHFIKSIFVLLCQEYTKTNKHPDELLDDDSLIEEEVSDIYEMSIDGGWTKRRIQRTIRNIYLFAAQLPTHIALDSVEYISSNAMKIQLD